MTTENMIAVAQILVGTAVGILVPVVGWVVYEIISAKTRIVALETRVDGADEETDRRFKSLEGWLQAIDHKLDRLIQKETKN